MKRDPRRENPKDPLPQQARDARPHGVSSSSRSVRGLWPKQFNSGETKGAAAARAPGGTTAETASSCVVKPEQTEGPYFVDEMLNHFDTRVELSDGSVREGVPLDLTFNVSRADGTSRAPSPDHWWTSGNPTP